MYSILLRELPRFLLASHFWLLALPCVSWSSRLGVRNCGTRTWPKLTGYNCDYGDRKRYIQTFQKYRQHRKASFVIDISHPIEPISEDGGVRQLRKTVCHNVGVHTRVGLEAFVTHTMSNCSKKASVFFSISSSSVFTNTRGLSACTWIADASALCTKPIDRVNVITYSYWRSVSPTYVLANITLCQKELCTKILDIDWFVIEDS